MAHHGSIENFVALDLVGLSPLDAVLMIKSVHEVVPFFMMGLEPFLNGEAEMIARMTGHPLDVSFIADLGLCGEPDEVARAVGSMQTQKVGWVTVHAFGGEAMLAAATRSGKESHVRVLAKIGYSPFDADKTGDLQDEELVACQTELVVQRALLAQRSGGKGVIVPTPHVDRVHEAVWGHDMIIIASDVSSLGTNGDSPIGSAYRARFEMGPAS